MMTIQKTTQDQDFFEEFVPFTARMMAAMRAIETERADKLFSDPFAKQLAGAEAFSAVEKKLTKQDQEYVAVRTRFFDDFLLETIQPTKITQVIILASGLDTRPFRLSWPPQTKVYELDKPEVLVPKANFFKNTPPTCLHYVIGADLTQPWEHLLIEKGYLADLPSLWLLEGLMMYLTEAQVHNLLQIISTLTSQQSYLGLDLINTKVLEEDSIYRGYFLSGFDHPETLLNNYGWQSEVFQPGEEGANYNRYTSQVSPRSYKIPRAFLIKAQKTTDPALQHSDRGLALQQSEGNRLGFC